MPSKLFLGTALITLATIGTVAYTTLGKSDPPKTVDHVDLSQYVGLWYEISSIPLFFQKGCTCSTANYSANDDGTIKVVNTCLKNGKREGITGKASAADATNSKLKVQFFWPFSADYWIVRLDADYRWAVVSNPDRSDLWILSRTQHLDQSLYDSIIKDLKADEFHVESLVLTSANC